MAEKLKYIAVIGVMFIFSACGTASRLPQRTARPANPKEKANPQPPARILSKSNVKSSLKNAYDDWKGTPYEFGGISTRGVDCSAFMQIIFDEYLNIDLPRSTNQQIYVGRKVNRSNLQPGDLIFFKTGRKTLHVGVIVDNRRFLHASTSQGVTISSLKSYYWRSRFLTAKRVLR